LRNTPAASREQQQQKAAARKSQSIMSNDLVIWCLSFGSSLALLIILTAANTSLAASSSTADVLIIRHGRSRVRHSTEKDHIRWGLKAFDNLTLDYSDFEANATDPSDLLFPNSSSIETNATESFLSTAESPPTTSTTSTVATPTTMAAIGKKKIGKRKIMENIKKNVDKGLAYLKAHFDLDDAGLSHYGGQHQIDAANQPTNGEYIFSKLSEQRFSTLVFAILKLGFCSSPGARVMVCICIMQLTLVCKKSNRNSGYEVWDVCVCVI
jgi:hypothetical protein